MNFSPLKPGLSVEGASICAYHSDVVTKNTKALYLIAGTHGDEVEGVYVLEKLYQWLKKQDQLQWPIIIIPTHNVDGLRLESRQNAHGVDLNRNFPSKNWSSKAKEAKYNPGPHAGSEPETQFLLKLFKRFPPKFVLSFHSWKAFINFDGHGLPVAEFLAQRNHYPILETIENHPTPGSLGHYATELFQAPVLTLELPTISQTLTLEDIWLENRDGLQQLFNTSPLSSLISDS